jgi:hypothetical protein
MGTRYRPRILGPQLGQVVRTAAPHLAYPVSAEYASPRRAVGVGGPAATTDRSRHVERLAAVHAPAVSSGKIDHPIDVTIRRSRTQSVLSARRAAAEPRSAGDVRGQRNAVAKIGGDTR